MKKILKFFIRVYQWTIGLFVGECCRFYPSCSNYCLEAVEKHGVFKGGWLAVKRIVKCGPWHQGGVDEVP
ncbi:MAG: membrane protein insertion efficiency factor YidD [Chlamydiae bacterium]|nr:membrane protein insertion efficiency factor YidD [Chlamydiota bacterium]